ncbi:hypothetical protein [Roseateles paludis]|jgi:hypothetical protein|uniref:Phage portal protein n=1 Tax=Roseateles paludis TaxID=3145238 RepID=A0ABV0FYZ6_9BURK
MPITHVAKEDFEDWLEQLADELWAHANSAPESSIEEPLLPEMVLRACFQSVSDMAKLGLPTEFGGRAQFDIWWTNCPSRQGRTLMWERWECWNLTRAEYESLIASAGESELGYEVVDEKVWRGDEPPLKPLATWKYHPERMRGVMPFAARVAEIGRQCRGSPSVNELNLLAQAWSQPPGYSIIHRPLRQRINSPSRNSRATTRIVDMLVFNAVYCANGRQVFDIPQQLSDMFRNTDVDDITAEHIRVPYPGIYLHFGPQSHLAADPAWTPEGAYIQEINAPDGDRALQFCIVSAPTDLDRYREFDVNIEPVYVQALGPQHMKMALGEAVELVLAEKMQALRKQVSDEPMANLDEATHKLAANNGVRLVSTQGSRAAAELAGLEPMHRAYLEMLKLIVNSLAYLTAYPKDVETVWPKNTSAHLLRDLAKTDNRNEQRRIQSRLAALGFTPVHLCGRKLAAELDQRAAASGAAGTVAAHWRRGHWRRQPHGPQNMQRKLVWLMPTLVNSGKSTEEVPGHLYMTS